MRTSKPTAVNVADAKRQFSDLLGRVAYGRESIVITRRGRPMAKLVPIPEQPERANELADLEGWLADDDPFFAIMEGIVADRPHHPPRVVDKESPTEKPGRRTQ